MRHFAFIATAIAAVMSAGQAGAFGWDPIGDITHPERIIRNVGRTVGDAARDVPNVPRNVEREIGNAGREIDRMRLEMNAQAGAPVLEQWLVASRNSALAGSMPMPPNIRQALRGYYDEDLLNRARFKIGDAGAVNLANLSISYGDAEAVTLIDVVVFKSASQAYNDPALWAHELKHVQQFRDWGVRDFSIRYLRSWNGVENDAYAAGGAYHGWARARMQNVTNVCRTPYGAYQLPFQGQVGGFCQVQVGYNVLLGQWG